MNNGTEFPGGASEDFNSPQTETNKDREFYGTIARYVLAGLGHPETANRVEGYLKGNITPNIKKVFEYHEKTNVTQVMIETAIKDIDCIPDYKAAERLVTTAISGIPAKEDPDKPGEVIVVEFPLASKSKTKIMTKIHPNKRNIYISQPNLTDNKVLLNQFMQKTGFTANNQAFASLDAKLKRAGRIDLIHPANGLHLSVNAPSQTASTLSGPLSWAYNIQITHNSF